MTLISLMTMKKDPMLEEKLKFYLKIDMRNLVNLDLSNGNSKNLHFWRKYVMLELERYREVVL